MATRTAPKPAEAAHEQLVMSERNAIISSPEFGVDDRGGVTLRFEAYVNETECALQVVPHAEAIELLKMAGVSDVTRLHGYPIVVRVYNGRVEYVRPWQANGLWNRRTVRA